MASPAAANSADIKKEKMSFAKIAAAGIKPPNVPQNPNNNPSTNHKHEISSAPRDGANDSPSNGIALPQSMLKPKKLIQLASRESKDFPSNPTSGPQVRVQLADHQFIQHAGQSSETPSVPAPSDDASSNDSNKPPSMDGKSVASGTTFNALDEKESLRPDDSASVKAVEDEDLYSAPGSGRPSRPGSDVDARAFRDQLREISAMDPTRRGGPPPAYGLAPKGVLYVPPQGPGIGAVPTATRGGNPTIPTVECRPDQKLLDALDHPQDRVWVLKLEQDVLDFVKDAKESSLTLPQCHSFYRLLAHKMADYYMLGHIIDDSTAAVRLYKTPNCRIPPPLTGITAPSTAASTPPPMVPAMKILRRGDKDAPAIANGSGIPSKNGSDGESGDEKKKGPKTREQREAAYEAARLRIMGSAKPQETPETPKEKQDSRSSSAAGAKKHKKKTRADDDDGFEARSAYSNFFTTYGPESVATPAYTYPPVNEQSANQFQAIYGQQSQASPFTQQSASMASNQQWNQQPYQNINPTQAWAQGQTGAYDLSADFQRMSTQNQMPPQQSPSMPYDQGYGQQYFSPQQNWQPQPQPPQQQQYPNPPQSPPSGYGYTPNFNPSATSPSDQTYQFGQLPSQAFPGRPPNMNEHPLPGSYKGKNFNPQSQTFVPGQSNGSPVTPQGVHATPTGFRQPFQAQSPVQLVRHASAQSQTSSFGSPHQHQQHLAPHRALGQPLTHPLPQGPVFPRQTSPNVPLPAKPGSGQPQPFPMQMPIQAPAAHTVQAQSLLAKWGTPSSLPAKPPPSREPFDSQKISQIQRQPFSAAAAARQPGGYSPYSMPPGQHVHSGTVYKG